MGLGWQEILLILVLALLLFGAKRLPEIGRALGQGMREFKRSITGIAEEMEKEEPTDKPHTKEQA